MAAKPGSTDNDLVDLSQRLETASFRSLTTEAKAHISETCNISKRKRLDSAETVEFMATAKVTENGMRGVRKLLKSSTTFACERDCRQLENQLQVCTWLSGVRGSILFSVTSKLTFSFALGPRRSCVSLCNLYNNTLINIRSSST